MGNELFCNYSIDKASFVSGGHLNLWKIYKAIHKESKQEYSLFVFDKKTLEQFPLSERDELLSLLKQEAECLSKYQHHNILSIIEPLVEDKYSMGFITESFAYTLSSWLIQSPSPPSKLEIKVTIKELCHTIAYLHDKCHIIHNNINPDIIFIDKDNKIKLSGMAFALSNPHQSGEELRLNTVYEHLNQNLIYIAPEIVFQGKAWYSSDIYSIGLLILKCLGNNDNNKKVMNIDKNTPDAYKRYYHNIIDYYSSRLTSEHDDNEIIVSLLNKEESKRPTIKDILQYTWLINYKVQTLYFIENLSLNDITKNYEFLKCLPNNLILFDSIIITKRFLPALLKGLKEEALINPILPAIFTICNYESITLDFEKNVWPRLKEIFLLKTIPTASLYLLLTKITFIGDNIPNIDFATYCFSLILKAMDCGVAKIQSVISDKLSFVSEHIESQVLIRDVYPRIMQILLNTQSNSLKEKLFISLKELLPLLDNKTINEKMIIDLEKICKKDTSYLTIQGMVVIYEEIGRVVSIDNIVNKIIPNLVLMMSNGTVSIKLYNKINEVIQGYFKQIRMSREKDFCNEEDYVDINDVSSIDSPDKKLRKDKESNGEGLTLVNFFGGQDVDSVHLSFSYSNNNNGTTMNSSFQELNGDYFVSEDNKRMEFNENFLTQDKISTQQITNCDNNHFEQKKKEKNLKIILNKSDEKSLFDSLLNDDVRDNEDEAEEALSSFKVKGKIKKITMKNNKKEKIDHKKIVDSPYENSIPLIKEKKEVKSIKDEDIFTFSNKDSIQNPILSTINKSNNHVISPSEKKRGMTWNDDEEEEEDNNDDIINKQLIKQMTPIIISTAIPTTNSIPIVSTQENSSVTTVNKGIAWFDDDDEENEEDVNKQQYNKAKEEEEKKEKEKSLMKEASTPTSLPISNTSPTTPSIPKQTSPQHQIKYNNQTKEINSSLSTQNSIKKSSTSKKPTIKKKKQSLQSKEDNLLDLESLLD